MFRPFVPCAASIYVHHHHSAGCVLRLCLSPINCRQAQQRCDLSGVGVCVCSFDIDDDDLCTGEAAPSSVPLFQHSTAVGGGGCDAIVCGAAVLSAAAAALLSCGGLCLSVCFDSTVSLLLRVLPLTAASSIV